MNMENEYGPTSEVMPNSTRDRLVDHEIVFTEYGQIWIGERHFHPWEISWPLFYVLGHKDQVKCYHNNQYRGKWWSIILHNSSLDIHHHSHTYSGYPAVITGHPHSCAICSFPLCPFLVIPPVTHLAQHPYTNTNTHTHTLPFDLWGSVRALNTN